jgi:hypothetical protein
MVNGVVYDNGDRWRAAEAEPGIDAAMRVDACTMVN